MTALIKDLRPELKQLAIYQLAVVGVLCLLTKSLVWLQPIVN